VINPKLFVVIWIVVTIIWLLGKKAVGFVSG
jgi:bacteriorhodopsin